MSVLFRLSLLYLLFQLCSVTPSNAQNSRVPFPPPTGVNSQQASDPFTTDVFTTGSKANPVYKALEEKMNQAILRYGRRADNEIVTLPVVFHIVDEFPSFFTDSQVEAAINALNDAFAKAGTFATGSGVDTRIRFCLAKKDPDGGITTGITRTVSPFGKDLNPHIEDSRLKNLVQWDPSRFINIWYVRNMHLEVMARFQCGAWVRMYAGGYATMPPGGGPTDGIVVSELGNLLTHEMGHYLGLYHTFEGLNCANNNCATDGDRVCDTPPDASFYSSIACDKPDNSCTSDTLSGFTVDVPDMISNFMDYANDACHNAFTQGQADRMKAAIATQRPGLLENKCEPPCSDAVSAAFTRTNHHPLPNDLVQFTNTSSGATRFEWRVKGAVVATTADYSTSFPLPGKYKVTLKAYGAGSCFSSLSHEVIVTCGVTARFYTDKRQIASKAPIYLDSIRFSNASVGAASFTWLMRSDSNPAEQVVSTAKDFTYVFTTPGNYTVRLIATNGTCSDTTQFYSIPVTDPTPDGALFLSSVSCYQETKLRVSFFVCNYGYMAIPRNTPISFYDRDPRLASAVKLGTYFIPEPIAGLCCSYLYTTILDVGYKGLNTLFGVFNDNGTAVPVVLPDTSFGEKDYRNNIWSLSNFAFKATAVPARSVLEWGDTLKLRAQAGPGLVSSYRWTPAQNLSCTSCQSPYLIADTGTVKRVVVTSTFGCTDTATVVIEVPPYNDFSLVVDDVQCAKGDSLVVRFTIRNSFKRAVIPKGLTAAFYNGDPTGSVSAFLPAIFSVPDTVRSAQASFTTKVKSRGSGKIYGVVNDTAGTLPIVFPKIGFPEKAYGNNYGSVLYEGFRVTATPPVVTMEWQDTVQLSANVIPAVDAVYHWSPAANLSCANCQSPLLVGDTSTTKKVIAVSSLGCTDTTTVNILVPPYNDFTVAFNDVQCAKGDSLFVNFTMSNSFKRPLLPKALAVSFYNGDPRLAGAVLLPPVFTLKDTLLVKEATFSTFVKGMLQGNLYAVINDSARQNPVVFPATTLLEKAYENNVTVQAYKPEELRLQPADTTVFRKESFPVQLQSTVFNAASTVWSTDMSTGLSCTACPSPVVTPYHPATINVKTENRYGCLLSGLATVKIFPPDMQVKVMDIKCYTNDTALVAFTVCMNNGYDSVWKEIPVSFYDGATSASLLPPVFRTPQLVAGACANYTTKVLAPKSKRLVAVVNDKGDNSAVIPNKLFAETNDRNNSDTIVYTPFTITIHPADTVIDRLSSIQLASQAAGGTAFTYLWKPAQYLSCSSCETPVVSPPHTLQLELKAQNEFFCTDTALAIVRTQSQEGIYIPNAFTPNGDGRNDVLYVMAGPEVVRLKTFAIYNRWGQAAFMVQNVPANTPQHGWRGKVGGQDAPPEVYVYYVVVILKDGKEKAVKGTVTLIR